LAKANRLAPIVSASDVAQAAHFLEPAPAA
jgi:hypothetical protein